MPYGRAALAPDTTHATVRSYSLKVFSSEEILVRACREGNIQAVIKGLKIKPNLRKEDVYVECWDLAAVNGHSAIVWFFFDLLAQVPKFNYSRLSLEMAVKSGDLEIFQHFMALLEEHKDDEEYLAFDALPPLLAAITTNQDEMIEDLIKDDGDGRLTLDLDQKEIDQFAEAVGMSGQYDKVELVLSLLVTPPVEVRFYDHVLTGAAQTDRLALAEKVIPLTSKVGRFEALDEAIGYDSVKVARYLLDRPEWSTQDLVSLIPALIREHQDELLEEVLVRLEGKDWSLPAGTVTELKFRKKESFLPLARQLLSHATPENLRCLRDLSSIYNNEAVLKLTKELLGEAY